MKKNRFFKLKNYFEQFNLLKNKLTEMIKDGSFFALKSFDRNWLMQRFEKIYARLERIRVKAGLKLAGTALAFTLITNVANSQTFIQTDFHNPFVDTENPFRGLLAGSFGKMALPFVQMVDIDNDGDLDMLVSNNYNIQTKSNFIPSEFIQKSVFKKSKDWTSNIEMFENIGTNESPEFEYLSDSPFAELDLSPISVNNSLFADLDNDADYDLITSSYSYETDTLRLKYFENQGTPELANFVELVDEENPFLFVEIHEEMIAAINLKDLDGDEDLDMLLASSDTCILYFENKGTLESPEFEAAASNPFEGIYSYISKPELVDIDNDGDLDLFNSYPYDKLNGLNYYENIGSDQTPVFELKTGDADPFDEFYVNGYFFFPDFADIDNDGDYDVVMPYFNYMSAYMGVDPVIYFKNIGTVEEPEFEIHSDLIGGTVADFVDIDGDSDLDLTFGSNYNSLLFFQNNGNPQLADFNYIAPEQSPFTNVYFQNDISPLFNDLDNDGDYDLLLNNKQNTGYPSYIEQNVTSYFENQGTSEIPNFVEITGIDNPFDGILGESNIGNVSIKLIDIDADADFDFLIQSADSIRYFENIGNVEIPEFEEKLAEENPFVFVDNYMMSSFDLADVDLDGDFDFAYISLITYEDSEIIYFENTGTVEVPVFENITGVDNPFDGINTGIVPSINFVDLDNDLDFDVLFSQYSGAQIYYKNTTNTPASAKETKQNFVEVYPNPSDNYFFVEMQKIEKIEVYDVTGKIIFNEKINTDNYLLDLSGNVSGVYFMKIVAEGKVYNHKIVLE